MNEGSLNIKVDEEASGTKCLSLSTGLESITISLSNEDDDDSCEAEALAVEESCSHLPKSDRVLSDCSGLTSSPHYALPGSTITINYTSSFSKHDAHFWITKTMDAMSDLNYQIRPEVYDVDLKCDTVSEEQASCFHAKVMNGSIQYSVTKPGYYYSMVTDNADTTSLSYRGVEWSCNLVTYNFSAIAKKYKHVPQRITQDAATLLNIMSRPFKFREQYSVLLEYSGCEGTFKFRNLKYRYWDVVVFVVIAYVTLTVTVILIYLVSKLRTRYHSSQV